MSAPAGGVAGAAFERRFERAPEISASAPGRVNLIGEHTDYNGGFVLPVALPLHTRADLARRDDDRVRCASADLGVETEYRLGGERRAGDWVDFVRGVTSVLAARGEPTGGFDLFVSTEVPIGAGLASSAALLVAVLRALRRAFGLPLDDTGLARVAHEAEHGFVGAKVGVMDPMVASLGRPREALFLDARSLGFDRIALPDGLELVVIDSGLQHEHASGGYNRRREECEQAARALGVASLREVGTADLPRIDALPDPLGRRARHVVTENARVIEAVAALRAGDLEAFGALLVAAHVSLRDLFEVSTPEIDALVEIANRTPGIAGARLTGGGFGGAIVAVARAGRGRESAAAIAARFAERTGRQPSVRLPA